MADDIIISNSEQPPEQEAEFVLATPHEDIAAAYSALTALAELDTAIMPQVYEVMKRRIIRKSIQIIDEQIKYIHDCIFFDEKDEE